MRDTSLFSWDTISENSKKGTHLKLDLRDTIKVSEGTQVPERDTKLTKRTQFGVERRQKGTLSMALALDGSP